MLGKTDREIEIDDCRPTPRTSTMYMNADETKKAMISTRMSGTSGCVTGVHTTLA